MPSNHRDILHPLLSAVGGASLAEAVCNRVREAIRLGLLAPGQQLPSEAALAARLEVSTMTLREALVVLREQGLVETRRGRNGGSFVIGPSSSPETGLIDRLRTTSVTELRDLGDESGAITGMSARLAATRASDANIAQLHDLAAQLANADSPSQRVRAHTRFHVELSLASQSERLTRAQLRLQAETGELLWVNVPHPRDPAEVSAALAGIAETVDREEADLAQRKGESLAADNPRWLIETHLSLMEG